MNKHDFDYFLPAENIAQQPLPRRSSSRMLRLERRSGMLHDDLISMLPMLLEPGDLLVLNDTRVLAARLHGHKPSGGRVEIMIERVLDSRRITAKIGANRPLRAGARVLVGAHGLVCEQRNGELFTLLLEGGSDVHALLDEHGHVPLPPYIRRPDTNTDRTRYQTLWARHDGAVAAPTAGLHFDADLLQALQERGVEMDYVTLHVGSGTYQRLREGDLRDQRLHAERVHVGRGLCTHVAATKARHKRVIAVGTTVVRSLEAAATTGVLAPFSGETELFIKPGDRFNVIDALITNFHEPQSSLLMLVCAFAGREQVLAAYAHACEQGYRFLSYGDAMFIS